MGSELEQNKQPLNKQRNEMSNLSDRVTHYGYSLWSIYNEYLLNNTSKGGVMQQAKKEVLNLTSKQFQMGFHQSVQKNLKQTQVVELQPQTHKKMLGMMKMSESSFNVAPINVLKDIISQYEPDMVILDDVTSVPGALEVITNDLKIPVLLDSASKRQIFRVAAVH